MPVDLGKNFAGRVENLCDAWVLDTLIFPLVLRLLNDF